MSPQTPGDGRRRHRDPALSLRRNHRISAPEVQVVLPDGQTIEVMRTAEAIARAFDLRLDLVEVTPEAHPPMCRMMDFGKYVSERMKRRFDGL